MARTSRPLILALAFALGCAGCARTDGVARRFRVPASLDEMLGSCGVSGVSDECIFQIADGEGEIVPHALLRMDWPDLGRVSFQTDGTGSITIRFPKETDLEGVVVSVERKSGGQDLVALPYDECTELVRTASVLLTVR